MVNGENGYVRKWHLGVAVLGSLLALGGVVFRDGALESQRDMKIEQLEQHLSYDDSVLARKDVVEQRLAYIEEEERKIEELQRSQNAQLQEVLIEARRRQ